MSSDGDTYAYGEGYSGSDEEVLESQVPQPIEDEISYVEATSNTLSFEDMSDSSSDDEDEEMMELFAVASVLYMLVLSVYTFLLARYGGGNTIQRMYTSDRRTITSAGSKYIHRLLCENPEHFRQEFRMYPFVFQKLCKIIREKGILQDTRYICVEEMIALFLTVVGQNHRYPSLRRTFGRSHFATSQNFHRGLHALNVLAVDFMAKPSQGVQAKIRDNTKFFPYFKECIGALDGMHIPAKVDGRDISKYRNRHGAISQNVLAACNFDLEFLYVLAGWEGSAHDSKVLNAALTKTNPLTIPQGKYYLVDCGFPNRRHFLAPFRGVRYHLQDFNGVGRHPENGKELFNLRHASLRNIVERIFGIFKSRFTIFKSAPPFPYKTQVAMVLACVGLHNFLRKECRSDEFPPDDEPLPPWEEVEDVEQTQEQQRVEAGVWRDGIVQQMWHDATEHAHIDEP